MAIETVPVVAAPGRLSPVCFKLASDALFEITNLSILMRDYIAKTDELGMIEPVTRGMLARVQLLSEVVCEVLQDEPGAQVMAELTETVDCRRRPAAQSVETGNTRTLEGTPPPTLPK